MSARDALSGYQFRHTPADEFNERQGMDAYKGGERAGQLLWSDRDRAPLPAGSSNPGFIPRAGEILWAGVEDAHRGQGLAKEMLRQAHAVDPRIHHGKAVSPEGEALVRSTPEYGAGR